MGISGIGAGFELPGLCRLVAVSGSELQTEPIERFGVIQFLRRGNRFAEPFLEIDPGHVLRRLAELVCGESLGTGVTLVGEFHHVIQALGAIGRVANSGVQQKAHHGSLDVIADGLVAAAHAGKAACPHVIRCFFKRLHQPARRLLQGVDVRRQPREILLRPAHPSARQHQVAVVACQPFGDPQAGRAWLLFVVERSQFDRPQPLDVEGMEILMARQPQPGRQAPLAARGGRVCHHQGGVFVLQPAAAFSLPQNAKEGIPLEGQESPHPPILRHDFRQVAGHTLAIPLSNVAAGHHEMLAAVHFKFLHIQIAGDNRRIHQRVKIRRPKVVGLPIRPRHPGPTLPASTWPAKLAECHEVAVPSRLA